MLPHIPSRLEEADQPLVPLTAEHLIKVLSALREEFGESQTTLQTAIANSLQGGRDIANALERSPPLPKIDI